MKKLSLLLILALTSCVYSDGDRAGQVVKLSRKGLIFKTYEGELATLAKGQVGTMMSNTFHFTVKDEAVANKIRVAMELGGNVSLHYDQAFIKLPWEGETAYFVTKVSVNEK